MAAAVIHPIASKENPRGTPRGFLLDSLVSAADIAADDVAEQLPPLALEAH
jgi:hypothetical protein